VNRLDGSTVNAVCARQLLRRLLTASKNPERKCL